jgi:hypothetical protein
VRSGTAGQPVSLQVTFQRKARSRYVKAEQSRAPHSWHGGLLLRIISGSSRFYMTPPRACGEWLDLAPRPLLPLPPLACQLASQLACFSFHRCCCCCCSCCSMLVFICCCCGLGLMTAFSDRGAYLITNSHPPTSNRPQADVLTAGRPITAALTPGIQLGVML